MSKAKVIARSKIKPFLKYVNYNHIMPTRYIVNDLDLRSAVNPTLMKKIDTKETARSDVKKAFQDRFLNRKADNKKEAGVNYFFHKLRF